MAAGEIRTVPISEILAKGLYPDEIAPSLLVLVVDDEHVIAEMIATTLRSEGYAVLTAYDAESALDLLNLITPDLLITDICMPGLNGVELAMRIRRMTQECGVLLLSALPETSELLRRARRMGFEFRFLSKPATTPDLITEVRKQLQSPAHESKPRES